MQPATAETVLGDFSGATITTDGVASTFSRQDGEFRVRTTGEDGTLADFRVAYTFGAIPLQQYLIELPRGRYQALGLAWDSRPGQDGGQRWFPLYPDGIAGPSDPLHWTGPQQNWNYMCAECHSTGLVRDYAAAEDRFATTWSDIDVACEACHGPGYSHAEDPSRPLPAALRDTAGGVWTFDGTRPTARRSEPRASDAEIETCGRCHSRRGWVWEEVLPGRPLADTHRVALLDQGLYHDDGQILDEVYEYGSFAQSRMHAEGVTCSDCHDPHSGRLVLDGNALCGTCHAPAAFDTEAHHHHAPGGSGSMCVACHMPERTYMVVDPRRDHSFRVPRPDLTVAIGTPNACGDCHAERGAEWAADEARAWFPDGRTGTFHFGIALHAARIGRPDAPALLRRVIDDPAQPAIVRATALDAMRRTLAPDQGDVLLRAASDPGPLVRRTAAEAAGGLEPERRAGVVARLLDDPVRTVRLAAAASLAGAGDDRLAPDRLRALEDALGEYRASLRFEEFRAEAQFNLGNLERQSGRPGEAEVAYRRAIDLDPSFVPAHANLADLLAALGRNAEGARVLRESVARLPESAELRHALGLALARNEEYPAALDELRRAAELAPQGARFALVYAVALHDTGDTARALDVLRAARDVHPYDPDIRHALSAYEAEGRR